MPTRLEAIETFLSKMTHPELARMFNKNMEVQVNVGQDGGKRVQSEYNGRQWLAWTDDVTVWKSFRIPYKANTEPEYTDKPIKYDLGLHAEGIGMTGWNWQDRQSYWLAYDFDAITGHSDKHTKKLTELELLNIQEALSKIPWVQLRSSTSGKGLHMYVHLSEDARTHESLRTNNHHEHAALARALLSTLCALCTYDFNTKVDITGGNMWVWHRKMVGTNGLNLIKAHNRCIDLKEIPQNWRDHLSVARGQRKKVALTRASKGHDSDFDEAFESLTTQQNYTGLDTEHKRLIDHLQANGAMWWWQPDHNALVCHTHDLKCAFTSLGLKGVFDTLATGTESGSDINCYAWPLPKGAWSVRRYGRGTQECSSWTQDGTNWTKCVLNRDVEFDVAMRLHKGVELEKGGYQFNNASEALPALKLLGCELDIHPSMASRAIIIKKHKEDGKVVVSIRSTKEDKAENNPGFVQDKMFWKKVCLINIPIKLSGENEIKYDDVIRHLITPDSIDAGWVIKAENSWVDEPLTHVKSALVAMDYNAGEAAEIIGANIFKPWRMINLPFQPEYTGDRTWNRDAAQLRFIPNPDAGNCPTWKSILEHCGKGLDQAVTENDWCKLSGIVKGSEYLKCWITSLIKEPLQPLPYLFFYSEQQHTGKSTFHESLSLLFTRGVVNATTAIQSPQGFNGELENAVLCTVEEVDLKANKIAYGRIKEWVTAIQLNVHHKGMTPYMIPNTTHWCQFANSPRHCPVFPGDTRITMVKVEPFTADETIISRKELQRLLEKEAPDFLASIMLLELPPHNERLNIPVLETEDKKDAEEQNQEDVHEFFELFLAKADGHAELLSNVYTKFLEWLPANKVSDYTVYRFAKELPSRVVKGRLTGNPNVHVGNCSFDNKVIPTSPYIRHGDGFLRNEKIIIMY